MSKKSSESVWDGLLRIASVTFPQTGDWREQANCKDTDIELWFNNNSKNYREELCGNCVVNENCLEYALDNSSVIGYWAGTSEKTRRKLRKERAMLSS